MTDSVERRRTLPSVHRVLATPTAERVLERFQRGYITDTVRAVLDEARGQLQNDRSALAPSAEEVMATALARIENEAPLSIRAVINASGVVLHTNLGRAGLAEEALRAAAEAAVNAVNLEYDLERGSRGERDVLFRHDLCALSGAEDATAVNNNAAAVLLALNTLAEQREVIVSRGQLVEIGGSFRIPDVMAKSGAVLREVGTTNRTHPSDYAAAIGASTALLLRVHTSNYRIVGFTSEVTLEELVAIGRQHGVPVMEDLGSGALLDLSTYGLPKEPVVAERVQLGADLVTFSGDKLLGGPQCGLIVGRRDLIQRINRNPLKRAVRCDKMTLAALAATLRLYRTAPDLPAAIPTLRWLTRPLAETAAVGERAVAQLQVALGSGFCVALIDSVAEVGSGALPAATLASKAISITHPQIGAQEIAARFRAANPPIIGRVQADRFLLDLRCIVRAEDLVPQRGPRAIRHRNGD